MSSAKEELNSGNLDASNNSEISKNSDEIFKKLSNIFRYLEKKGLVIKNASYIKTRTDYVRGDDLIKVFKDNLDYIINEINLISNTRIDPNAQDVVQLIFNEFYNKDMIYKVSRVSGDPKTKYPKRLTSLDGEDDDCCGGKHDKKKHKTSKKQNDLHLLEEKCFYALDIEEDRRTTYFWLIVAVTGVLAWCLFPVWPLEVKIAIWWISYILLVVLITTSVVRLILFGIVYPVGRDFWLFPNMFDDKLGVLESFRPLYSISPRSETLITRMIKITITLCILYIAYYIYQNPESPQELVDHLIEIYFDVFDYGKDKIINWNNSTAINIKEQKYMNQPFDDMNDDY